MTFIETAPPVGPETVRRAARLGYIDGLRGIAILAVIWHHWFEPTARGLFTGWSGAVIAPLAGAGHFGVAAFFVLSGFVLHAPYAAGERRLDARGVAVYLRHRARRLLPLFLVAVTVSALIYGWRGGRVEPLQLIQVVTLTFPNGAFILPPFNGPLWSISAEIWFSALFPALALLVAARGFGVAALLGVASVACAAFSPALSALAAPGGENFVRATLAGALHLFLIGMAAAEIVARAPQARGGAATLVAGGVGCVLLGAYAHHASHGVAAAESAGTLLVGLGAAAVIVGCARSPEGWTTRALSNPALRTIGMMCFSLYVWHEPVRLATGHFGAGDLVGVALNATLLAAAATASYRFIEFGHVRSWRALFPILDERRR